MKTVKNSLEILLQNIVKDLGVQEVRIEVEHPKDVSHGDYTTNLALIVAKKLGKKPQEVAEDIKKHIQQSELIGTIDHIDIAGPGFINITLSKEYLLNNLYQSIPKDKDNDQKLLSGKKIMVEFTDPNPFKEFHIGHLYSNTVGESLSRLLESQGAQVLRVTYQGDVGLHVAKALYSLQKAETELHEMKTASLKQKVNFLGKCYAAGSKAYEEDTVAKEEIHQINKKIYDKSDSKLTALYEKGREWSLSYFETIYQRLGSTFVKNYFESVAGPIGLALVRAHIKDGIFKESQNAVIFEGEKFGLHNRVFINSLGLPTYEAKDMGLPETKYKDFPYDQSLIITAEEQSGYFEVVLKALSLINPELAAKTKHIAHGVVRLPEGKMSSRTGNVLTGEWLLNEVKARIASEYKEMTEETAEKVAVGAVKYALLKSSIGKDITFDFKESVSIEGNSGPYLQYTFVRTQSVLKKAGNISNSIELKKCELESEEMLLLRILGEFDEILEQAALNFAPNTVCTYLFELAKIFNLFYQHCPILTSEKKNLRVLLTQKTGETLKNGLYLLSIQVPQSM